jgi:peptidyl-prolyl cis-trans isomerase C
MKSFLLVIVTTFFLTACGDLKKSTDTEPTIDISDAVAIVNGAYISKESLENLTQEIHQRSPGTTFAQKDLIEELIQRKLLVSESKK